MKKRLISVSVGLVLLATLIIFFNSIYVNIVLCLIGLLAAFEVHRAYGVMPLIGMALIPVLMFCGVAFVFEHAVFIVLLYLFASTLLAMASKKKVSFQKSTAVFAETVLIGYGLASVLYIREAYSQPRAGGGVFITDAVMIVVLALAVGWICDTFAFTFGSLFGKRKMAPEISPNKTIAGAVGGIVGTPVVIVVIAAVYSALSGEQSIFHSLALLDYVFLFVYGLLGAFIGMMGDLAASFIKRECGVKDFGKIMPGHGGALDRIDSVLFTIPFTLAAFLLFIKL